MGELVLTIARSNPTRAQDERQGAPTNNGHQISAAPVGNTLKANGIERARSSQRQTTSKTLSKPHWQDPGATDFTTTVVSTKATLLAHHLLFAGSFHTSVLEFCTSPTTRSGPFKWYP